MNAIFRFIGTNDPKYEEDRLKFGEHHILGNKMRINEDFKIIENQKWHEIKESDRRVIRDISRNFTKRKSKSQLKMLLQNYF